MQTHEDGDIPQAYLEALTADQRNNLDALSQKAADMSEKLENVITAGRPGEPALLEATVNGVLLRRMPDDPLEVIRISIGEASKLPDSTYCVFRGDPFQMKTILRRVLKAVEQRF